MNVKKPQVLVLVGPTASGKTALGVELAKQLNGEIISADSMQIYQGMNIGTAKVTEEEMAGIAHHLVDCVRPDEDFSVARFKEAALASIELIYSKSKLPIIVGGTGLYINSLTLPWDFQKKDSNEIIRQELANKAKNEGKEALYKLLKQVDPVTAGQVHPNNVNRVIRALEIYQLTGKPKSQFDMETSKNEVPYEFIILGLDWDREMLYERINRRVEKMIENGLIDEAKRLLKMGYDWNLTSMKAIGYKELRPYLEGETSLEEAVAVLKRDSRHYAKRQMTWFRKDERIHWIKASDELNHKNLMALCLNFLEPLMDNRRLEIKVENNK